MLKNEITAKEAFQIIKDKYIDQSVIECFELSDCYAFGLVDKGRENELCGGGYCTVNKYNGCLGGMTSVKLAFSKATSIEINKLKCE